MQILCFENLIKAWFSFRLLSVHSAAHRERNRPEGHLKRLASRNGPSARSRRHDAVADHHQHLRTAQKKETQRHQHIRRRRPAPERKEEDTCAHRRWGVFLIFTFKHTLSMCPIYQILICSFCFSTGVCFLWDS